MSNRLRIGLLGCGGFADRHARNLQLLGDEVALAAGRGVHVFIKKPIALSSGDGWDMV